MSGQVNELRSNRSGGCFARLRRRRAPVGRGGGSHAPSERTGGRGRSYNPMGGENVENRNYEKILNSMPETGVYVVREEDHGILYFNRRGAEASPKARLGVPCHEVWAGSCASCPLLSIEDGQESRAVSYNELYGGVVDITASRTMWEGDIPAFVLTVAPRMDSGGYTYRKLLHVDLDRDRCSVLKSDPEGWQPGEGPLSAQMAQFAVGGAIHEDDVDRFVTFTRMDYLRRASSGESSDVALAYRRKTGAGFRWNLMEVIPDQNGGTRYAVLCVKDVDDVFREGMEREGVAARSRELIRSLEDRAYIISSLSSLFFSTYYIDLEHDTFRAITQLSRVGGVLGDEVNCTAALSIYANHFVHPDDRAEYLNTMGVKNLRDSLRWWQPCVAFEYRKLSEEPGAGLDKWSWVRVSAVLARTGKDDLPQTAVYMAQDISDSRRSQDAESC